MNKIKKLLFNILIQIFLINSIVYASEPGYSLREAFIKLILYMLIIVFVISLAVLGTRFLAKQSRRLIGSRYMNIVDMLNIGANNKILMIEIGDYIYVIAMTNNSSELIEKIKKDEFIKDGDFEDKLNKYTLSFKNIDSIKKILRKNYENYDKEDENGHES
ncbi:MAG TPA: FliO/MopB family protein [Tissierellia bacterium]|nr:FliO/MopB family protein [Tissierellia bacterium]